MKERIATSSDGGEDADADEMNECTACVSVEVCDVERTRLVVVEVVVEVVESVGNDDGRDGDRGRWEGCDGRRGRWERVMWFWWRLIQVNKEMKVFRFTNKYRDCYFMSIGYYANTFI